MSPRPVPEVSVIVPTRLRPERLGYLAELHTSLTQQTLQSWEMVLALDGADPARIPAPLAADERVRPLPLPRPVGAAAARNLGLHTARAPVACFADDDDLLTPDSLEIRHRHLAGTGLGWTAGRLADLHPDGTHHVWRCPTPPGRHQPGDITRYWTRPEDPFPLGHTMLLARTPLLTAAGGHGGLPQGEDALLVTTLTTLAPGELLPHVVYLYRQHAHQMTAGDTFGELEASAREFTFAHAQHLRDVLARTHPAA